MLSRNATDDGADRTAAVATVVDLTSSDDVDVTVPVGAVPVVVDLTVNINAPVNAPVSVNVSTRSPETVDLTADDTETPAQAMDTDCVVCMEPSTRDNPFVILSVCSHSGHLPCLMQWFDASGDTACPLCRSNALGVPPSS